jgi:fimbrial chaperone protein
MLKPIAFLLTVLFCVPALGAEFSVTPIRLDFERGAKTGAVTVSNDGTETLHAQLRAFEWSQDAEGKDHYEETQDLVFFPKLLDVESHGERIVRVGIRLPATVREKTYRLFIEEIPAPHKEEKGATIAIAFRFGVPVFVKPPQEDAQGEIAALTMNRGEIRAAVNNTGNRHFIIQTVRFRGLDRRGAEAFVKESPGWYLLSGAAREYTASIPKEVCGKLAKLVAEVSAGPVNPSREMSVDRSQCQP